MRVPKGVLWALVEEARACGMGPVHLGRLLGYSRSHMSKIAVSMGMGSNYHESAGSVRWSEKLVELLQAAMQHCRPLDVVAHCPSCGRIVGGIVRPQQTQSR